MTEPEVRWAAAGDAAELARLRWEFRAELGMADEPLEAFGPRFERFVHQVLDDELWTVAVAAGGAGLVGHAFGQLIRKVPVPNQTERHLFAYVTNVYVEPARRGDGIGARLMRMLVDWAREHEADAVVLWPSIDSRPFYLREGFAPSEELFQLDLSPRAASVSAAAFDTRGS